MFVYNLFPNGFYFCDKSRITANMERVSYNFHMPASSIVLTLLLSLEIKYRTYVTEVT